MKKRDYWAKRLDQLYMASLTTMEGELKKQYKRLYEQTLADLTDLLEEIESGIVHEGGINERGVLVSDLYRANSYHTLLSHYNANLIKLGSKEITTIHKGLSDMYLKQVQLTTTELMENKSFTLFNPNVVETAVNAIWCADGKNWSQRLWDNHSLMSEELRKGIVDIVAGKSTVDKVIHSMNRFLKDDIEKGYNRVSRLVRTELAYVQNKATLDRFIASGVKYYKIISAVDACSDCAAEFDNQVFEVDDAQFGINMPPLHPNCRCCIVAVFEPKEKEINK